MAKKKTTLDDIARLVGTHGTQIRDLTTIVEKGFAAVAADIADIRHDMVDMKRIMATKEDVRNLVTKDDLRDALRPVEAEIIQIRRELEEIKSELHNVSGYAKEIDHALERIARIERHLGLDKQLAA